MATHTCGTNANNSLTAVTFQPGYASGLSAADIATISQLILRDNAAQAQLPAQFESNRFSSNGTLFIPGRGYLVIQPGDVVGVDNVGWPILISKYSIANGAWTFT